MQQKGLGQERYVEIFKIEQFEKKHDADKTHLG